MKLHHYHPRNELDGLEIVIRRYCDWSPLSEDL